jgi:hypothetical protein
MSPRDHCSFAPACITHRFSIPVHNKFARCHKPAIAQIAGIAQVFVAGKSHTIAFAVLSITKLGFPDGHD